MLKAKIIKKCRACNSKELTKTLSLGEHYLSDFAKENSNLELVAGYFESKVLPKQKIIQIASLPSREVLLAMLCATLNGPVSRLARVINMIADKRQEA